MRNTTHAGTRGFSLVELLIAITILAILSGIVTVQFLDAPDEAKQKKAKVELKNIETALEIYLTDNGFLPTSRQGLEALIAKPTVEPIPANYKPNGYLKAKTIPKDPWNRDYVYLSPGSNGELFEVLSYGKDGEQGGEGYDRDLSTSDAD